MRAIIGTMVEEADTAAFKKGRVAAMQMMISDHLTVEFPAESSATPMDILDSYVTQISRLAGFGGMVAALGALYWGGTYFFG
jgi:hypothetical protein